MCIQHTSTLLLIMRVVRVQPKSVPIKIKWNWPAWMRSFSFLFLLPSFFTFFFLLSLSFFYLIIIIIFIRESRHVIVASRFICEFCSSSRDRRHHNRYKIFILICSIRHFIRSIKHRSNGMFSLFVSYSILFDMCIILRISWFFHRIRKNIENRAFSIDRWWKMHSGEREG